MSYRVVFDAAEEGYSTWPFVSVGLVFILIGVGLVLVRRRMPGWWGNHPKVSSTFAFFFAGFAVLWTSIAFLGTYSEYSKISSAQEEGRVEVVEGTVRDFIPMPYAGHAMERFCIQSKCFEYSDYDVTSGFNNTSSHGGPIREGLPVRVTFVGGTIVKLEVKE